MAIVLPERRVQVLPADRNPFLVYIGIFGPRVEKDNASRLRHDPALVP